MALTIKANNGIFLLEGVINTTTVKQFKNHLEFLILYTNGVTINIDGVSYIDANGMKALRDLYSTAIISNKDFIIVGYGCKEVFQDFETNIAA